MEHHFKCEVAAEFGMLEAVLISNFVHWIRLNRDNGRNERNGRTWTYNSVSALHRQYFYTSADKVRRALENLVNAGVLVKDNFNEKPTDRTTWYAFADEEKWVPELAPVPNANGKGAKSSIGKGAKSHTDIKPDGKPDSAELEDEPKEPGGAWWADEASILKRGAQLGLDARPGESMDQYKARISSAIAGRAEQGKAKAAARPGRLGPPELELPRAEVSEEARTAALEAARQLKRRSLARALDHLETGEV